MKNLFSIANKTQPKLEEFDNKDHTQILIEILLGTKSITLKRLRDYFLVIGWLKIILVALLFGNW